MRDGAVTVPMNANAEHYTCDRCGTEFPITTPHTEIVRRDLVDVPRPSRIERLCTDCWEEYVEDFLGRDFEAVLEAYGAPGAVADGDADT